MKIGAFKALYPNFDIISFADSFFGSVKLDYNEYLESGFFNYTDTDAIYIYRVETSARQYMGLLVSMDMDEYSNGNVIKHEKTLSIKEQKSTQLLLSRKAMIKPALLTYPKIKSLSELIKKITIKDDPFYSVHFEDENSTHCLWQIKNKRSLNKIIKLIDEHMPHCYISDGHHRFAVMEKIRNTEQMKSKGFDQILTALFSFDQIEIYDFNRVIEVLDEITPTQFIAKLSDYCKITPIKRAAIPLVKHEMTMFINNEWYRLRWKKSVMEKYKNKYKRETILDVSLFNDNILKTLIGMEEVRSDERVKYISGLEGLHGMEQMVNKNNNRIGFCLHAIDVKEFKAISDAGRMLPPKSTWFEPRMKNGLVVEAFDQE